MWRLGTYAVLTLSAVVMLIPFAYLVCGAIKTTKDSFAFLFLPRGDGLLGIAWDRLTLRNIVRLLTELDFGLNIFNSALLSSVTAVLATLVSAMAGYALAKFQFRHREWVTTFVLSLLVVPGVLLLPPTYQLLYRLGLLDTYAGLILPGIGPAFGVYLFRQAIMGSVPDELLDASRVDGCGEMRIFFTIVMPLIRPMVGAFLMIVFLGMWNNFIGPQVIIHSPDKLPLAAAIAQLKGVYSQEYGLLLAGTLVSVAPVVVLFLLLQKDFIAGLTSGAVKG